MELVAWFAFCGGIGALIGRARGRISSGLVWGVLLGPLGWLVTALLPDHRLECPLCKGTVPQGAVRCMHCGYEPGRVTQ
jgi:hypothetical protein